MTGPEIIEIGIMGPQGVPGSSPEDLKPLVTFAEFRSEDLSDTTGFAPRLSDYPIDPGTTPAEDLPAEQLGLFKLPFDTEFYAKDVLYPVDTELRAVDNGDTVMKDYRVAVIGRESGHEATWVGSARYWNSTGEWFTFKPDTTIYEGDGSAAWDWYAANAGGASTLCFLRDEPGIDGYYYGYPGQIDPDTGNAIGGGFYPYLSDTLPEDAPFGRAYVDVYGASVPDVKVGDYVWLQLVAAPQQVFQGVVKEASFTQFGAVGQGQANIQFEPEGGIPDTVAWDAWANDDDYQYITLRLWRRGREGMPVGAGGYNNLVDVPQHGIDAMDVYMKDYFGIFGGVRDISSIVRLTAQRIEGKASLPALWGAFGETYIDAWELVRRGPNVDDDGVNDFRYNPYLGLGRGLWRVIRGGANLSSATVDTYQHRPAQHPDAHPIGAISLMDSPGFVQAAGDILEFAVPMADDYAGGFLRTWYYQTPGAGISENVEVLTNGVPYIGWDYNFNPRGASSGSLSYFDTYVGVGNPGPGKYWIGYRTTDGLPWWLAGFQYTAYMGAALYETDLTI